GTGASSDEAAGRQLKIFDPVFGFQQFTAGCQPGDAHELFPTGCSEEQARNSRSLYSPFLRQVSTVNNFARFKAERKPDAGHPYLSTITRSWAISRMFCQYGNFRSQRGLDNEIRMLRI